MSDKDKKNKKKPTWNGDEKGKAHEYFKADGLFPDGFSCPECGGKHFHPTATILPNLWCVVPDKKGKDGKTSLWVARSECLDCKGWLDWTFHPDFPSGYGNEFRAEVKYNSRKLDTDVLYGDFPRSRKDA
jgi:hypothetical protein